MSERSLEIRILTDALVYIESLKSSEREKIFAQIALISEGDYSTLHTKQLSGQIRELIVKQQRIIFFRKSTTVYFVGAFKKQSAKTPKREIEHAKSIYKNIPSKPN